MVRSLSVVGVFVLVILLITLRESPDRIKAVDPAPVLQGVAQAAPFAASVPGPTPEGWTVTSARVTYPDERPYTWYVGYSTDTEAFVAVTQAYGDLDDYLEQIAAGGDSEGSVVIEGDTWEKFAQPDGSRQALIRTQGEVTTVVVGTAPFSVLERTAAALVPAKSATSAPSPSATPTGSSTAA